MADIGSDFSYVYEGDGQQKHPCLVLPGPSGSHADLLVFDNSTGAPTIKNNVPFNATGGGHTFSLA